MTYSTRDTELRAFEAWAEGKDEEQVGLMAYAIDAYRDHTPCEDVALAIKVMEQTGAPFKDQIRRDRLMIDVLVTDRGLKPQEAVDLWCDWEAYERALIDQQAALEKLEHEHTHLRLKRLMALNEAIEKADKHLHPSIIRDFNTSRHWEAKFEAVEKMIRALDPGHEFLPENQQYLY